MDVEIEQDDLNQKLLTSLAPEWLMYTIVWRNKSDLDTMSLDDLYNHLKVYEPEVQKKSDSQNMAFISSTKNSSGNEEVNIVSIPTASTQVSPASANVAAASISLDTACAYIASQSNGSQIKYDDINQIDKDDIEEMDIKWNMALLSMRANRYWKKTGKKISIQGTDMAGFDKLKVECFNCHKMGHFARECRAPRSQDRGRRENYRQGSKEEEQAPKALMAIDGVGWDWSYMKNEEENHALVADEEAPTEFTLMAKSSSDNEVFDSSLCSKACKKNTNSLNSKITNLKGLRYSVVPPPSPAQVYSPSKKDMSWTGLLEFVDDTITDYSWPTPSIESNSNDLQNNSSSVSENGESTSSILYKPQIKFAKATDSLIVIKTSKDETVKKPSAKYAEMYRKISKSSNVRGNQRNWNNLKSQQLGKNFLMKSKACFNCGDFDHLSYDCGKWVDKGKSRPKNNTYKSIPPRNVFYKSDRTPMRINRPHMNDAQPKRTYFSKPAHLYVSRPFQRKSSVRTQVRVPRVPTVNRKFPTVNRKFPTGNSKVSTADLGNKGKAGNSQNNIDDKGYWDSGFSRHMTGNISYLSDYKPYNLSDYEPYDGGYVSFGQGGCKITGKGNIKTGSVFPSVEVSNPYHYAMFESKEYRQYTRRARIAQSSALPIAADEPASPLGDDSQDEACPTVSGLEAEQDRANIIKTSTLLHDSPLRVTSLAADKGSRLLICSILFRGKKLPRVVPPIEAAL
nr:hypothetical protein [Tanacetum cinerariifolium]